MSRTGEVTIEGCARHWQLFGIGALGLSALFALLLVASRIPGASDPGGIGGLFYPALVLHVNLSVLIWLLASAAAGWAAAVEASGGRMPLSASLAGVVLMLAAPLFGETPVLSNYVPVLEGGVFLSGLGLFAAGPAWLAGRYLYLRGWHDLPGAAALVYLTALGVFALAGSKLALDGDGIVYEQLFWGGGHLLQLVYLLVLVQAWFQLLEVPAAKERFGRRYTALLLLTLLAALWCAATTLPADPGHRTFFTALMQYALPLLLLPWLLRLRRVWPGAAEGAGEGAGAVRFSLLLLLFGLLLGSLIRSDTVIVTAHYHATNGAVTLALMALAYRRLHGRGAVRAAARQLRLYAAGMAVYISGMAWSGWLALPRKTAGSAQGLDSLAEQAAMAMMGLGGAIAVSAVIYFVWLMVTLRQWHSKSLGVARG